MYNSANRTPLQQAMRVSVLNIVLNFLLVLLKTVTGILAKSPVLVSDAVHSAADTLCTVLVLSGIGYAANHPGILAKRLQTAVICLLSVLIAGTGLRMMYGGIVLLTEGSNGEIPGTAAVAAGAVCMTVKAMMFLFTRRYAIRTGNPMLLADAFHHRADCASSLLVLISVGAAFLQCLWADALARLLLGGILVVSAVSLCGQSRRQETQPTE
ncbi:MAG: cation transporter [Clostridia bacterium]|nr:cation transporter [Clostridia bacterium]